LGIQRLTVSANTTVSSTTLIDVTSSINLAANTTYRIDASWVLSADTASGLLLMFQCANTLEAAAAVGGNLGHVFNSAALSNAFYATTSRISLRGATTGTTYSQARFAGYAYFRTAASTSGKFQIGLSAGTTTGTLHLLHATITEI
jgi:hypothetical protein